jgi:hypothetical protein
LEHFEDFHAKRIRAANKIPVDPSVFDQSASNWNQGLSPVVKYSHLEELYSCSGSHKDEERKDFFDLFKASGGCVLLEFAKDDKKVDTLNCMWSCMTAFYAAKAGIPSDSLMQQYLPPISVSTISETQQLGGYDFVQTFLDDNKQVVPTTIQDFFYVAEESQIGVSDSFMMLASVSKMIATVVASGALNKSPQSMERVIEEILDGYSCCNHRLCQYLPLKSSDDEVMASSSSLLRSHTDWTLVTSIPVSPIPGLLVFHPSRQEWMAPDMIGTHTKNIGNDAQYCLVMAGKSLDLLLGYDTGLACIHQVMPLSFDLQRLSAPFFLRTKESISQQINDQYNQIPCSKEDAIFGIHKVFKRMMERSNS